MTGAQVIVVYPKKEGSTFNKEYYLSTHMPLVAKVWKEYGLVSYTVTELNAEGPHSFSVVMNFDSREHWGAAAQSAGLAEIMADVPNFSSEQPLLVHGGVISEVTV